MIIQYPYIYKGSAEISNDYIKYEFSGVLHDSSKNVLSLQIYENGNVLISNQKDNINYEKKALLIVNPEHQRYIETEALKQDPEKFFKKIYNDQTEKNECPYIIILNLDSILKKEMIIEFSTCIDGRILWGNASMKNINNEIAQDRSGIRNILYLGYIITLPVDIVITPVYFIGWGLLSYFL
ncbi:MAG: hypothetical protein HQK76_15010 [Desulfobacterales bacterium]|nr:hypothetical protein [Desulfobacterales bacterium]